MPHLSWPIHGIPMPGRRTVATFFHKQSRDSRSGREGRKAGTAGGAPDGMEPEYAAAFVISPDAAQLQRIRLQELEMP
jgi:hypothetical protein